MINTTKIYLVTNCFGDPSKVYVGKTINSREIPHKKTYGKQIEYSIIDEVNSLKYEDWGPLECFWIEYYKFLGFTLMNKNKGGGGPEFWCEEFKIKYGKGRIGKKHKFHVSGLEHGKYGFLCTLEQKKNISEAKKGQKYPTLQKSVIQYDLKGNEINIFNSISEANVFLGKNKDIGSIGLCCKGKLKKVYGFQWKWKA